MYRLGSFFDMMRISSSATNCTKGVYFCSAVLEKLTSKFDLDLPLEAFDRTGSGSRHFEFRHLRYKLNCFE